MPGQDSGRTLCNIVNCKAVSTRTSILNWECLYNVDDVMVKKKVSVRLLLFFLTEDGQYCTRH